MRILHLSWEYPPVVYGGLGRHVHALAEAQASLGHEVAVLTQHEPGAPADESRHGVRILRVPQDPPLVPQADLLAWVMGFGHGLSRAGARLAREWEPDVVHGHDWLVAHAGAHLKTLFDVPLVATVHATEAGRHQGWLPGDLNRAIHTVEWWLTYEARRVVTCSSHMRWEVTRLFDLPPDKVDVVPNGIDLDRWAVDDLLVQAARDRYARTGPLVLFTGRLEWEKGAHTLVEALPRLRDLHPGATLVVAGRGSQEDELRALAGRLGLSDHVHFTGWLPDVELPALAAAADVAVVPSIYEPFGMAALESVAAGTPLVVADTGGLRELVEHGVTGVHFTPGDVDTLVGAVGSLLDDHLLARRLVHDGREVLAERYRWTSVAQRTDDIYRRAVDDEEVLRTRSLARGERPLRLAVAPGNLLTGEAESPT
jgi:glycogen(starch) synthase